MEFGVFATVAFGLFFLFRLIKGIWSGQAGQGIITWNKNKTPLYFWGAVFADALGVVVFLGGGMLLLLHSLHIL